MGNRQANVANAHSAGYRIIKCHPGSLAQKAALEEYFDFIITVNEEPVDGKRSLASYLQAVETEEVTLEVYNPPKRTARRIILQRPDWGGPFVLGATVRYANFESIVREGLRVLKIEKDSPAEKAGLSPAGDWILGTADGVPTSDASVLAAKLAMSAQEGIAIGLMVYNAATMKVREVLISPQPTNDSRTAKLGAELGSGFAHRIPIPVAQESRTPTSSSPQSHQRDSSPAVLKVTPSPSLSSQTVFQSPAISFEGTIAHDLPKLLQIMMLASPSQKCAAGEHKRYEIELLRPPCFSKCLLWSEGSASGGIGQTFFYFENVKKKALEKAA